MLSRAVGACLLAAALAQVQVKGRFQETVTEAFFAKEQLGELPVYRPARRVDNFKAATDEVFAEGRVTKPYKFAESVAVDLDVATDGHWQQATARDGTPLRVWQAVVASEDAVSLSLQFAAFHLPQGSEFYMSSRDMVLGAFTPAENNKADNHFATAPLNGDHIVLLLAFPDSDPAATDKAIRGELLFRLATVAHGFRSLPATSKNFGDSAGCNIDVACETQPAYVNPIRAVALLMTRDGTHFCSGTLINNTGLNKRQLFLTANHCMFTAAYNMVAVFNYQHKVCGQASTEPPTIQSAAGMRLLARYAPSDFALLEIVEQIPTSYNAYLAGWSVSKAAPSHVFGVHHPSGDVKKISFYNGTCVSSYWDEYPRRYHWEVPRWSRGTTEPGSSGSGLFNQNGQLVGQLHGGEAACSNPTGYDVFGKLDISWTGGFYAASRLRDHLNPRNLPVTSLNGMALIR